MPLCRSALLAAILLAVAPSAAHAATASVASGTLSYVATEGDANQLSVTIGGGDYTISDLAGHAIGVGAGCFATGTPSQVTCPTAGITTLNLDARDRDDTIALGSGTVAATLTGGAGDDAITGGDGGRHAQRRHRRRPPRRRRRQRTR